MMTTPLWAVFDVLALALAAQAVQEAWFSGSIFDRPRRAVARRMEGPIAPWWARLLACPLCTGYHVVLWLAVLLLGPGLIWGTLAPWGRLALGWLAATRLVQLGHMALPKELRPEPIVFWPEGPPS